MEREYLHVMPRRSVLFHGLFLALVFWLAAAPVIAGDMARFVGTYAGTAEVERADGTVAPRDMSVTISETRDGFEVEWSSTTYRQDGRSKEKTYKIEFVPSDRGGVFSAAMKRNVFGHDVQLDPMKGEPYVWSRVEGDTLTVFSLFVAQDGGYELQQFDRTLVENGLELYFQRLRNGEKQREIKTFLTRQ